MNVMSEIEYQNPNTACIDAEKPAFIFSKESGVFRPTKELVQAFSLNAKGGYCIFTEGEGNDIILRPHDLLETGDIVYHYCSVQTLMDIIKSKKFWLSDPSHMNDSEEMRWGFKVLIEHYKAFAEDFQNRPKTEYFASEILDSFRKVCSGDLRSHLDTMKEADLSPEDIENFHSRVMILLDKFEEQMKLEYSEAEQNIGKIYVGCFSANSDQLSQWRGYGDDGRGVTIGFYREWLDQFGNCDKVYYTTPEQKVLAHRFIRGYINGRNAVADWYVRVHPFIKPYGFHEEREYRVAYSPLLTPKLSRGTYLAGKTIRQYYSIPLQPSSIGRIILGPKCSTDQRDLVAFLEEYDMNSKAIEIKRSSISYR